MARPAQYHFEGPTGARGDELFEIQIREDIRDLTTQIRCRSRLYEVEWKVGLRHDWPGSRRLLIERINATLGATIRHLHNVMGDPRSAIHALRGEFEREISHSMEQLELDARRRSAHVAPDRMWFGELNDPYHYGARFGIDPGMLWGEPPNPEAKKKATALLLRNLTPAQAESYDKDKHFEVTGKDGKVYKITNARSFNVIGPDGTKYCGQLSECPVEDQMLAQKLLLEHEPEKFFKNANVMAPATAGHHTATGMAIQNREANARLNAYTRQLLDSLDLRPSTYLRGPYGT